MKYLEYQTPRNRKQKDGCQNPGEKNRKLFNVYRVSILHHGKVLEMDGCDGCTEMRIYLMP
jgi:hypothetical protein